MINYSVKYDEAMYKTDYYFGLGRIPPQDTFFSSPDFYLRYHAHDDRYEIGIYNPATIAEVKSFIHHFPNGYKLLDDTIDCNPTDESGEQSAVFSEGLYLYAKGNLVSIQLDDPESVMLDLAIATYNPKEKKDLQEYLASNMKISVGDIALYRTLSELSKKYPNIVLGGTEDTFWGLYYCNEFLVPGRMVTINIHSSAMSEVTCSIW